MEQWAQLHVEIGRRDVWLSRAAYSTQEHAAPGVFSQ